MHETSQVGTERSPNLRFEGRSVETAQSGMLIIRAVLPIGPPVNPAPIHYPRSIAAAVGAIAVVCAIVFFRPFAHTPNAPLHTAVTVVPVNVVRAASDQSAIVKQEPQSNNSKNVIAKNPLNVPVATTGNARPDASTQVQSHQVMSKDAIPHRDATTKARASRDVATPANAPDNALIRENAPRSAPIQQPIIRPASAQEKMRISPELAVVTKPTVAISNANVGLNSQKNKLVAANIASVSSPFDHKSNVAPAPAIGDAHRVSQAITGQMTSADENAGESNVCRAPMRLSAGRCVLSPRAAEERK